MMDTQFYLKDATLLQSPPKSLTTSILEAVNPKHRKKNVIAFARQTWLAENGFIVPNSTPGKHSNLSLSISKGQVTNSKLTEVFGKIFQKQSQVIQILNGNYNNPRNHGKSNEQLIEERAEWLTSFQPELRFDNFADDSCKTSRVKPDVNSVIECLQTAHPYHFSGNLIIIARYRWLVKMGLPLPEGLDVPNLCIRIVQGIPMSAFYSQDLMHIPKKQNYFIQVLN